MDPIITWLDNNFVPTDESHAVMGKVIDDETAYFILPRSGPRELEGWDESLHPRDPKGDSTGGQFTDSPGGGGQGAREAAGNLRSIAEKQEPIVTKLLSDIADKNGGVMKGLDNNTKSEESLARKIQADMTQGNITADQAAAAINDANRYTMVYDYDKLVDGVGGVEKTLKENGYKRYDHKQKNFFGKSEKYGYEGYNTVWQNTTTGAKFEIQFHTPESAIIKSKTHKLYKLWRSESDPGKRADLAGQMAEFWKYTRPTGTEKLESYLQ